ncbi:MAG: hypothetical protein GY696_25610 [Gammaproteobacteria bacterium]|nr:hypothetical protein [Gammaproteobacteria bacterium]
MENARRWCPQPTRRPGACSCICGGPATHHAKENDPGPYEDRRGENSLQIEVDIKQNFCMPSLREDSEPSGQGAENLPDGDSRTSLPGVELGAENPPEDAPNEAHAAERTVRMEFLIDFPYTERGIFPPLFVSVYTRLGLSIKIERCYRPKWRN